VDTTVRAAGRVGRRPGAGGWALRVVLARLRPQAAILAVVLAVCLLAATLLSALAVLVDASERFGVRTALSRTPVEETRLDVTVDIGEASPGPAIAALDAQVRTLFGGLPTRTTTHLVSPLAAVTSPPALDRAGTGWLTYYADYDGITGAATLVRGRWPIDGAGAAGSDGAGSDGAGADGAVPVAIPERLATDLGLGPGDRFTTSQEGSAGSSRALVVGVYRVRTPAEAQVWTDDPLHGRAYDPARPVPFAFGLTANAYGPLVASRAAFVAKAVGTGSVYRHDTPDLSRLPLDQLHPLGERAAAAATGFPRELGRYGERVAAGTRLGSTLDRAERFLVVTRSSIIVMALLLLVLSLAALLLAARLLAERRVTEQSLMQARGASGRQLAALAATEALGVAAVVVVTAPLLARWLYRVLATRPDFVAAGMDVDPGVPAAAWRTAAAAGAVFVVVLLAPLLRRGPTFVESEQAGARQDRRTVLQRSGLDVALVALAAVAYWQLRAYRSPLVSAHVDPVLVAGPALALLGGALVTVRIVPVVARLLERLAARGRSVVFPLAAWEVGRRSRRAVGAVLLLSLALAVGTFGVSFLRTWRTSQQDQADFRVAADARVTTDPEANVLAAGHALAAVPGAGTLLPVTRLDTVLGRDDDRFLVYPPADGPDVQLLAVDSTRVGPLLGGRVVRPGGESAAALTALPHLAPRTPAAALPVPGSPRSMSLRVTATPRDARAARMGATVRLVLQDGTGARQVVTAGTVAADGRPALLRAPLVGTAAAVTPPLGLVAVQTVWGPRADPGSGSDAGDGSDDGSGDVPGAADIPLDLRIDQVEVRDTALNAAGSQGVLGTALVLDRPTTWNVSSLDATGAGRQPTGAGRTLLEGRVALSPYLKGLLGAQPVVFTTWPADGGAVAAVVSRPVLEATDAAPGQSFAVRVGDVGARAGIDTVVPFLPGLDPTRAQLLVDYDALTRRLVEMGAATLPVTEWWAQVPDARAAGWADEVTARGLGTATSRAGLGRDLQRQPLRVGISGALWLVVLAAAAFAGTGFAMHTTVAVRLRRVEFSQLRALGVTRRALTAVVWAESLLLALLGVGAGIGLGALLALLVAPMVSLAADGSSPMPPVLVHIAWWPDIALLTAGVCAVLAVVLLVVTSALRRSALGAVLRLGDER